MNVSLNLNYSDSGSFHSARRSIVKGFLDNRLIPQSKESRDSIIALQEAMQNMDSALDKFPLTHHFAPGLYAREMFLPANHAVIGKIHKHSHLNILVKGRVIVATEDGKKELKGGDVFTSYAGTKRAVNVLEDTIWITLHPTNETDLEKIEDELITKSYDLLKDIT